jgi:uncharacterized protein (TIGR03437 family)
MSRKQLRMAAFLGLGAALPILIYAYAEGPDAGYAGVPGELGTCTQCHVGGGSGSGSVTVAFANGLTYTPGATQHVVVTVADPVQRRWGFELTARPSSSTTTMAGSFTPGSDGFTQLVCSLPGFGNEQYGSSCPSSLPLAYIEHTALGTRNGTTGSATFQFDWTAPSTNVGNIVVYVAGNAANGNGADTGDHIYTNTYTLAPATASSPLPTVDSVVNGASFQTGITSGSWATIQGTNLAGTTGTWTSAEIVNGKLPTQLDNVSVTVDGQAAAVYYVSPTQINVQVPSDSNSGSVPVVVTNQGQASTAFTVNLLSETPAFFLWSNKYAVTTRQDFSLVGPTTLFPGSTTPAKPGDVVILWGTGFGATTPTLASGQLVPSTQLYSVTNPPTITVGGVQATVYGAALAPGFAGLYQIAIQIPATVASGDQPVIAQIGSVSSPSSVFVNIQ